MAEVSAQIAAIYARVSTRDQDCALQLEELRGWASRHGWIVYGEYVDHGESGRKGSRPELDRLLSDARARRFGIILVHRLDRFGRSVLHVSRNIEELDRLCIRFVATSQGIDTDHRHPASRLQLNMLAAVAQFEQEVIRERVCEGLARAQRNGVRVGRPSRVLDKVKIAELRDQGLSFRQIAAKLDVAPCLVYRRHSGKDYRVRKATAT